MLDAGCAVGNFGKIIDAHFLLIHAKRAVIGRHVLYQVLVDGSPQCFLVLGLAQGLGAHGAPESVLEIQRLVQ